jgi:hypothetical protein
MKEAAVLATKKQFKGVDMMRKRNGLISKIPIYYHGISVKMTMPGKRFLCI